MIIILIIMILFIGLGILLYNGKGAFLIAGYNTMPKEEREKYDEKALSKFMGKSMIAIASTLIFYLYGIMYELEWPFHVGTILMVAYIVFMIIYMNTGNRFKKQP